MATVVIGQSKYGGVRMRGVDVALVNEWEFVEPSDLDPTREIDVAILTKYAGNHATKIRRRCKRLIFDPLDCFVGMAERVVDPVKFWRRCRREVGFDEIIATSQACLETMTVALPHIKCHLLPHHADTKVSRRYFKKSGHVSYIGARRYISGDLERISEAVETLGRSFVCDTGGKDVRRLIDSGLVIATRSNASEIDKWCKPGIKVENAVAGGIPCVASHHPCIASLDHQDVVLIEDMTEISNTMLKAVAGKRPSGHRTLEAHCRDLKTIVENGGVE